MGMGKAGLGRAPCRRLHRWEGGGRGLQVPILSLTLGDQGQVSRFQQLALFLCCGQVMAMITDCPMCSEAAHLWYVCKVILVTSLILAMRVIASISRKRKLRLRELKNQVELYKDVIFYILKCGCSLAISFDST